MEWYEEDRDDLPPVPDLGPMLPADGALPAAAPPTLEALGPMQPIQDDPVGDFSPVPDGFFDLPDGTGFGASAVEEPAAPSLEIEPLEVGYDPIDVSTPISSTSPSSDTNDVGLDPIDLPDEFEIQANDPPYVNLFGVGVDLPDLPAFERTADNFDERVETPKPSGEFEALTNPFPQIVDNFFGAASAESQRTQYAMDNELAIHNVWVSGTDAPTREEAGIDPDAPTFGGGIAGPLLETGGQARRNIMRIKTIGDGLRLIGQSFSTVGDLGQAALQDVPFKTRIPTPGGDTLPSIGRVTRGVAAEMVAPTEGMFESLNGFLQTLIDVSERMNDVPVAMRNPVGLMMFRYMESLGNEMAADRALSQELGFDVASGDLTDEQAQAVGAGELNAYTPGATQMTIRDIIMQDQRVSDLQVKAQDALVEAERERLRGNNEEARRLNLVGSMYGNQAHQESLKDPFDYVDQHTSLWNEILFSSVLDFSPFISVPLDAIGLSAVQRKISKAARTVDITPDEYLQKVANATVKDEQILNQVGRHNYVTDVASLGFKPTDRSYANRAMYAVHRGITAVGSMVENKADMRKILARWLDEPDRIVEGFDDLRSPGLNLRSTDDGKAFFGLGALGTDAMLEARKALLAVRSEVDDLLSLTGDNALNHRVFYDELRELAYKGELKRRGSLSYDMPIGTGFVEAGRDDAGNAVVRYYNQKAKKDRRLVREDWVKSETRAQRVADRENKRIGDFRTAQADLNLLEAFGSVQRAVMSPLVLDISPRGLIRHVISNTAQLMADGVYKMERIDDQLEYIAKKYGGNDFLTARQVDALSQDVQRTVRGAYDYGNARVAGALQRIPFIKKFRELRSGATQLGALPAGEESLALTAGVQATRKFFRRYAPRTANRFGDVLRSMGKNNAFVRNAQSRLTEAMVDGSSQDVARVYREIVNGGSLEFSLSDYGPYSDVLGTAGLDELQAIIRRSYGGDRQAVLDEVRELFDRRTSAAQATLGQTGIEPGQTVHEGMDGLWDVAELTRNYRHVFRKAGLTEAQANERIESLTQRLRLSYEQGRDSLVDAVVDMNDPRASGWLIDTYRRVRESRAVRDEGLASEFDRIQPIVQGRTGPDVRAAWEEYWQNSDGLYTQDADRVQGIYDDAIQAVSGGELPPWVDAYDQIVDATRLDAGRLEAALRVDLGSAMQDQPIYEEVISAGRNFIQRSRARAYYMGIEMMNSDSRTATLFFNTLASADDDMDAILRMTRGRIVEARERLLPDAREIYYGERDKIQREGIRASQERWEVAAKELALHNTLAREGGRNPLEFGEDLIDDELESRLGDMVDKAYLQQRRLLNEAEETEAAFYGRFGEPDELEIDAGDDFDYTYAGGDDEFDSPLPDDRGEGEGIYSGATAARQQYDDVIGARNAMRIEWDRARAGAPGDVESLPSLQQAVNAYRRNALPDNDDWRNMVDALVEGSSFQDFESWLARYDQTFIDARRLRGTIVDSERFTTDTGARLSRDEIIERPDVQQTLSEIGFYTPEAARMGTRRDLLDILADAEGKMDGDYQSYFYSGIPLPALLENMFNIEEGSLLRGVWKNNRRSTAQGNVRNRLDQGTAARARIAAAQDAESALARDIDRWIYGGNEQYREQFTPAERQVLMQYLAEDTMPSYDNLLAGAALAGENVSSFVMVDFANGARHIDNLIGAGVPYHFWYTRAFKNMAERIMTQPGYVSRTANYYQEMGNYHEREDSPLRNQNKLPLPFVTMPNGDRILVSDPITALMPPLLTSYQFNEFANPDEGKTGLSRALRYLDMVGISFAPWWRAVIDIADGQEDVFAGQIIPPYQDLGWLVLGMLGVTLPGSLPDYHPYFAARQARNAAETGELSDFDSKMVMDMARRELTGEELLPEQIGGYYEKLYQKYKKRGAWEKIVPRLLSHLTGFNFTTQPQSELNIREASGTYFNLGYDPVTNPFGAAEASREALQNGDPLGDLPFDQLDTQFSLNSVTREQDRMRPGVAAVTDRAIQRERQIVDGLNALAVAASEATILAHPDQKPDRSDEIAAGRQAVLNGADQYLTAAELLTLDSEQLPFEIAQQVADIVNDRENPSRDKFTAGQDRRNPREEAGDRLEELVRAEAVGKAPSFPGQGASDADKSAYYAASDSYLLAKLDYIERVGGRITMEDDGPTPSEVDMLLAQMIEGEYAADMVRNYKHRYATAIQQNYYERLELDQAYRDYIDNQRIDDIRSRFGEDAVRLFEEYRAQPKGTGEGDGFVQSKERRAFWDANPMFSEINLFAYNPEDYEFARANFGNNIFDLVASYPKGDESGSDMKAWRNQYNKQTQEQVYALQGSRRKFNSAFEAQARTQYGSDIIDLADSYPSQNKGYSNAQRNAWIRSNQEGYARLKDFWDYRSTQYDNRDSQLLSTYGASIVAADKAYPHSQGDPRKAKWREENGAEADQRRRDYLDWYENRSREQAELVAPELGTPEATALLRYGRQPIGPETAGSVTDLVQDAQAAAATGGQDADILPGAGGDSSMPTADQSVQTAQTAAESGSVAAGSGKIPAGSGNIPAGSVTSEGAGDLNQRMEAIWKQYRGLGSTAEKAEFLRNNPEFADYYQSSLGLGDDQRWWLSTTNIRGESRNSFTRSGGGGGGGGGGGAPVVVQSSPYFASLASGARNVPRLGRSDLWVETPWPVFRSVSR